MNPCHSSSACSSAYVQVALEIVKVILGLPKESHKNTSLNLALPQFQMFEPVGPKRFPIVGTKAFYTTWDSWEVRNRMTRNE